MLPEAIWISSICKIYNPKTKTFVAIPILLLFFKQNNIVIECCKPARLISAFEDTMVIVSAAGSCDGVMDMYFDNVLIRDSDWVTQHQLILQN